MSHAHRLIALSAFACVALAACGGGGGGSGSGNPLQGGIEGSGHRVTSAGAVTALGSIFVNGVEYDTRAATVTIDGLPARESDLDVGQVAIVEGSLATNATTGVATRVTVGIALAGPIAALDVVRNRLAILGQTVELDDATSIEGRVDGQPFGGLVVGSDVEITGFVDSSGVLFARRIAPRRPSTPLLLTGYAANVDGVTKTFSIGGQSVSYAAATLSGFGSRALAGAPVRVQVTVPAAGTLSALRVELRDLRLPGTVGDAVVLQGWVTRFGSASDFDVDGHAVVTTASTKTEGPVNGYSVVRLDAFVTLTGKLLAGGIVEAAEVRTNNLIALGSRIYRAGAIDGLAGKYLEADLFEWSGDRCRLAPQTLISVDGVPAGVEALEPGEIADIYEHFVDVAVDDVHVVQDSICQSVAIQHTIRGPLEARLGDSGSFVVMGQRVWLDTSAEVVDKGVDVHAALAPLALGTVVEVSGHLTAEGDVLATGVHAAGAGGGYFATGIARDVDSVARQFRLGTLVVYYDALGLAGFAAVGPVEGDRVHVRADAAPSNGVLRASAVRYAGGLPRGAEGTFVKLGGLVTRHDSATDFRVDGRRTVANAVQFDPPSVAALRCDFAKLQPNLRFVNLLALSLSAAEPPRYTFALCPPGRRIDSRGPAELPDGWSESVITVIGPVQSVDVPNFALRVGGVDFVLPPDALLTRFVATAPDGSGTTTPVALRELQLGERVEVRAYAVAPGLHAVRSVLLGDRATAGHVATHVPDGDASAATSDVLIVGVVESAVEPTLKLALGLDVVVGPATTLLRDDCGNVSAYADHAAFWTEAATSGGLATITGSVSSGAFVSGRIYLGHDPAYCYGW